MKDKNVIDPYKAKAIAWLDGEIVKRRLGTLNTDVFKELAALTFRLVSSGDCGTIEFVAKRRQGVGSSNKKARQICVKLNSDFILGVLTSER